MGSRQALGGSAANHYLRPLIFMESKRYFDKIQRQLVYIEQKATSTFWDEQWKDEALVKRLQSVQDTYVTRITKKYLSPSDGDILEGGCGYGQHVAALVKNGYRCIGVDYAENTVEKLNQFAPHLNIQFGDVRSLNFPSQQFAGYWSTGVIEHFWDGYKDIGVEMARVIKPKGYLFLAFPHMSTLRQIKAWAGGFPDLTTNEEPVGFYQFALASKIVGDNFSSWGFDLIQSIPLDGTKGLKDEINFLRGPLQKLYDYRGSSFLLRGLRLTISKAFAPFAGHSILLVLQRQD